MQIMLQIDVGTPPGHDGEMNSNETIVYELERWQSLEQASQNLVVGYPTQAGTESAS